ncbi:hypothetical protein HG15A2_21980 [Adhaeretor mobilis]|uniref:Uncharacterized protein n=1 Tax=Adhaeretor mobilis TaxID=1930276 RepID=A0A517MVK2_9BACT|nr:hypothetical protein HG15A2_21980 [Adhaeretor mobilis]
MLGIEKTGIGSPGQLVPVGETWANAHDLGTKALVFTVLSDPANLFAPFGEALLAMGKSPKNRSLLGRKTLDVRLRLHQLHR